MEDNKQIEENEQAVTKPEEKTDDILSNSTDKNANILQNDQDSVTLNTLDTSRCLDSHDQALAVKSDNGNGVTMDTMPSETNKIEDAKEQELQKPKMTVSDYLQTAITPQTSQNTTHISSITVDDKGMKNSVDKQDTNDGQVSQFSEISKIQLLQQSVQQQLAQQQHISLPYVQTQQGITTYIPVDGSQGIMPGVIPYTGPLVVVGSAGSLQTYKTVLPQGTQLITSSKPGSTRIVPASAKSTHIVGVSNWPGTSTADTVTFKMQTTCPATTSTQEAPRLVNVLVHSNHGNIQEQTIPNQGSQENVIKVASMVSSGFADEEADISLGKTTPDELSDFARQFRQRRVALGFTQADVGVALGDISNNNLSQTTICRFEALQLSMKNMLKLKPLLEKWLRSIECKDNDKPLDSGNIGNTPNQNGSYKKRKRRTIIEKTVKSVLENHFDKHPRPSSSDISSLAESLDLEKEVVRVWFCNRRQKERRVSSSGVSNEESSNTHLVETSNEQS